MKEKLRKLILRWLFGTDNISDYDELLVDNITTSKKLIKELNEHIKTREDYIDELRTTAKLARVCRNHGIDPDEEIKHIKLGDEDFNKE